MRGTICILVNSYLAYVAFFVPRFRSNHSYLFLRTIIVCSLALSLIYILFFVELWHQYVHPFSQKLWKIKVRLAFLCLYITVENALANTNLIATIAYFYQKLICATQPINLRGVRVKSVYQNIPWVTFACFILLYLNMIIKPLYQYVALDVTNLEYALNDSRLKQELPTLNEHLFDKLYENDVTVYSLVRRKFTRVEVWVIPLRETCLYGIEWIALISMLVMLVYSLFALHRRSSLSLTMSTPTPPRIQNVGQSNIQVGNVLGKVCESKFEFPATITPKLNVLIATTSSIVPFLMPLPNSINFPEIYSSQRRIRQNRSALRLACWYAIISTASLGLTGPIVGSRIKNLYNIKYCRYYCSSHYFQPGMLLCESINYTLLPLAYALIDRNFSRYLKDALRPLRNYLNTIKNKIIPSNTIHSSV